MEEAFYFCPWFAPVSFFKERVYFCSLEALKFRNRPKKDKRRESGKYASVF